MTMVTIIGRGHSGTRALSHTLSASGVFMGALLNGSGDLIPPDAMYDACRVLARFVRWRGGMDWDWSALHSMPIPAEFTDLMDRYLQSVRASDAEHKGWKIPETTLVFPWIVRLFPDIKYVFWIRDPRDCILGRHLTDNLNDFGIPCPPADDERLRRAISWKYQDDLVQATPKPAHWLEVRFEDFVVKQDETLARLENYLGIKLEKIPVRLETVGRWKSDAGTHDFDFLEPALTRYGYEQPDKTENGRQREGSIIDIELNPEVKPYREADYAVAPMFLNRWSPRAFSPEPVDDETLMSIFEAARWAASSFNEQPWRFLLARSEEDRAKFLDFLAPSNQAWAKNAPVLALVVSKRTFSHSGQPNAMSAFDAGACSAYMTLQASLSGLVAHGMAGFDRDRARAVLNIPTDFDPMAVFAIGKRGDKNTLPPPVQEREVPSGRRPVRESVMEGGFQTLTEKAAESDTQNTS